MLHAQLRMQQLSQMHLEIRRGVGGMGEQVRTASISTHLHIYTHVHTHTFAHTPTPYTCIHAYPHLHPHTQAPRLIAKEQRAGNEILTSCKCV